MALDIFGFRDRPNDFAVTKVGAPLEECEFLLDFSRPLKKVRWLGFHNPWIGITVGLGVPVVHQGEESGGYLISVSRGTPYFIDIPLLWQKHRGTTRTIQSQPVDPLKVVADFGRHFPEGS